MMIEVINVIAINFAVLMILAAVLIVIVRMFDD